MASWRRLLSLTRKEFVQILRDPRTLALTFLLPLVQMFLLGYAATTDVKDVAVAYVDQDHSPASRALLAAYQSANYFKLTIAAESAAEIRALVDAGVVRAGLVIPPDYAEQLARNQTAQIAFYIDGSDPTVAGTALSSALLIGQAHGARLTVERLAQLGNTALAGQPLEVRTQVWFNPDLESAFYMIPALIGLILQFQATVLTATSIVRERERGTIEQLIVTPIQSWELIVGKVTPYVLVAFFNMLEVLVIGVLVFGVPINGSIPLLLVLSALFLIGTLGLGIFISTVANTQQEALLLAMFTLLPSVFLSGFLFPLEAMPVFLQGISYVVPLRYFLIITRGIILKGVGIDPLVPEVIALTIFGIAIMSAAALRFRKRLD